MSSILKIENLHVFYDNIHALKGISLEVHEGEIVSLIGANGAGKTTTLQTISGLIQAKQGTIHFREKDIMKQKPDQICKLGIAQVPEGRRIFSRLRSEEHTSELQSRQYLVCRLLLEKKIRR